MALIADFPLIHSATFIKRDVINTYSLLYAVEGTTKGKLPYLLASHLDVVPVDPSTWDVPPFGGKIVNRTYIYGRGAIDDKSGVLGIMEAVEYMIQKGQRPQRSFFLAFGHDEEVLTTLRMGISTPDMNSLCIILRSFVKYFLMVGPICSESSCYVIQSCYRGSGAYPKNVQFDRDQDS
ncbi:hypothetical protein C0J52_13191 [Blattella germanica]|nr:hypothetical protein C0J52_13191 [Blattella germanica]